MLRPISATRWGFAQAAHLLNRAGFGGTPQEIQRLEELGPEKAVEYLVDWEKIPDQTAAPEWAKSDPDRLDKFRQYRTASEKEKQEMRKEEQKLQRQRIQELRHWWLEKMAFGPRPLQEKLSLFWHGHFATSAQKVKNAALVWRQNEIFRRHGSGKWFTLLTEVSKDPAMLIWLDQAQSRKEHPNENFAREVMELFALGEGNYNEKDIMESARALTGWSYDRWSQEFIYRARAHDEGQKTIFGKTGNFTGEDVMGMIVEHPNASAFITRKLWIFFASENPAPALVDALSSEFNSAGKQFKPLLKTLFLSEEFYSPGIMRQQVKSPVQWLVGSIRLLERPMPPPQLAANALRLLGQDLFLPPNVKGWDGGLSWITTNNILNRYNFANYLLLGENPMAMPMGKNKGKPVRRNLPPGIRVDIAKLFPNEVRTNQDKLLPALERRFLQAELTQEHKSTLRAYLESQGELDDVDVLHAVRLVMSTPEYQLA